MSGSFADGQGLDKCTKTIGFGSECLTGREDYFLAGCGPLSKTEIASLKVKLLQFNHDTRLRERETLAEAARYPTIEALERMKE